MTRLFASRQQRSFQRNMRYLSRAFNDQFIAFLFIALVFGGYEYLHHLSAIGHSFFTLPVLLIISLVSLFLGRLATFFQEADRIFLISDLREIKQYLKAALIRSICVSVVIQLMISVVMLPALLTILNVWVTCLYVAFWLVIKIFLLLLSYRKICSDSRIAWIYAIDLEKRRVNQLNLFLNFFTDVKEIKHDNRPSRLWDWLIKRLQKFNRSFYWILFTRYFFRSRQLIGPVFFVSLLGIMLTLFLPSLFSAACAGLFILFALAYQLKSVFHHFDHHLMVLSYQTDLEAKLADFQLLAVKIYSPVVLCLSLSLLLTHRTTASAYAIFAFILFAWLIIKGYLPRLVGFKYATKK
ncbi:ABC transporter permease [Oenococcus kitaharae]|uniref:EcsB-like ABC transporterpermease n=1 Tax=Oenococcus kitaharae DSM 17330 TaxID=1045004 RepID=G9WJR3_9LACO|nr:ABC transporter permease [Oenococcus kitaharae]EHN59262.1 EcsB-like ABC transporterpermease [Oenococcus kitaharae DSM 17330]OEY82211.1 ABC transporter permease [Oenococcus kitaharae]OEY82634.1 ABC transporter permease [Oenococcus kitaharae]OEY84891.1 ABC transporter permease [Oenococcus kitaharae]